MSAISFSRRTYLEEGGGGEGEREGEREGEKEGEREGEKEGEREGDGKGRQIWEEREEMERNRKIGRRWRERDG